jgi:hypothetical protein
MELVQIGRDGELLLEQTLLVTGEDAGRDPQLQVGLDGRLHLVWRERGEPHATIHHVLLERDGSLLTEPVVLSDPDHWVVDAPRLILDSEGYLHAVWSDEEGMNWAVLDADGAIVREPTLLITGGHSPAAQIDERGMVHLAWQERPSYNLRLMVYAVLDPETGDMSPPEEMAQVFRRIGQAITGPMIGLDEQNGYLMWDVRDARDVSRHGRYASFPLSLPRQKRVADLWLESGTAPAEMYPVAGQRTPLLVALRAEVTESAFYSEVQIVVVPLVPGRTPEYEVWGLAQSATGGRPMHLSPLPVSKGVTVPRHADDVTAQEESEQVVTASSVPSVRPSLVVDDQDELHLAWLEVGGPRQYRVFYASTSPEVIENYNAITLFDIIDPLFKRVFRLSLVVLAAGPMLVMWALIPMGLLLVYHLISGEESLETLHARIVFGAASLTEIVLTLVFSPIASTSSWPPLRWVVPPVTAALAAVITAFYLRRRETPETSNLFPAFLTFTFAFSLLQLCIYFVL